MEPPVPSFVKSLIETSPADMRLLLRRVADHAVEERLSPEETRALMRRLGHENIASFCAQVGLAGHVAERWNRFGISIEMTQVLLFIAARQEKMEAAIAEFEAATHVGLDDFMRERGLA